MTAHWTQDDLRRWTPRHDSFVGIDSDGCVFPTMEIKQKECFHGLIAAFWGLESIEKEVREVAEFINLRSRHRGQNRFTALAMTFDMLRDHPGARRAGVPIPSSEALRRFIDSGTPLGNPGLETYLCAHPDPELERLLAWSLAVNAEVERKVRSVPPFRWARESLQALRGRSDAICVSQTPTEALVREWEENALLGCVALIAGQELGTKAEHLTLAAAGKYAPSRILMIGDALGDLKAARAVNGRFFPVNPGAEEASWKQFVDEAYGRFVAGSYDDAYEQALIREFQKCLPETPPWLAGPEGESR